MKCPTCNKRYDFLDGNKEKGITSLCGKHHYQIKGKKKDLKELKKKLKDVEDYGYCLRYENMTIFKDGRVLIKTDSEKKAKTLYSKIIGD